MGNTIFAHALLRLSVSRIAHFMLLSLTKKNGFNSVSLADIVPKFGVLVTESFTTHVDLNMEKFKAIPTQGNAVSQILEKKILSVWIT